MMERTLSIIKPDAVKKGVIGQIIARFEKAGLRIAAMKKISLTKGDAERFYAVHRQRPFFASLTTFMSSGPVVVMILEGDGAIAKNRELMGVTNPKEAKPGTLRADFGGDIEKNAVHGSDSAETATFETAFLFNRLEIL